MNIVSPLVDLARLAPSEVVFWSGAGISADPPTNGPLGRSLTDRALNHYFESRLNAELTSLLAALKVKNAAYRPRLETVLDALYEIYGEEGLQDVLSDLISPPSNANHDFFARHLRSGGRHITANFDCCIENALAGGLARSSDRLIHFHGSLSLTRASVTDLGARISVIQNGLPPQTVDRLQDILGSPTRALIFVGYSGSDFFDVTPFLEEHASRLAGLTVIWHEYSPSADLTVQQDHANEPMYLSVARRAGAHTYWIRGPLHLLCAHLATSWQLGPPASLLAPTPTWTPRAVVSTESRRAATVALAARMGLRGMVIGRLADPQTAYDGTAADRLADALWGAGRYRQASQSWRMAFSGTDDESRARLAERVGATRWIRGALVRAEWSLRVAIRRWVTRPDSQASASTQVLLVEAYGRVLVDMRRLPDTRWLVTPRKLNKAVIELARLGASLHGDEGIHLRARMSSVLAGLREVADTSGQQSEMSFDQSEALHAWLNYRHGSLRQKAAAGARPSVEAYLDLLHAQYRIGARGDAVRILLLPGAECYFSTTKFWKYWATIDVTQYHRLRLTAGFFTRRIQAAWSEMRE